MSPIESWDEALGPVYTAADTTWLVVLFSLAAMALFLAFLVAMIRHEDRAYRQIMADQPVDPGPAAEGAPPVY